MVLVASVVPAEIVHMRLSGVELTVRPLLGSRPAYALEVIPAAGDGDVLADGRPITSIYSAT